MIFDGADCTGKTTISTALANHLGYTYYAHKRPKRANFFSSSTTETHVFGLRLLYDVLYEHQKRNDVNIIFDRAHPSEYVYGQLLRGFDASAFDELDESCSQLKAKIILCYKTTNVRKPDEQLTDEELSKSRKLFEKFSQSTKCELFYLDTTDEDLPEQLKKIQSFMFPSAYELDKTYNDNFMQKYSDKNDGPKVYRSTARIYSKIINNIFEPVSVIDAGCATGYWLREFYNLGARRLIGINGSEAAKTNFVLEPHQFVKQDLRLPMSVRLLSDFVMSFEVAEHIEPQYAEQYVRNLTEMSTKTVFITAAPPGQRGDMHVNPQRKQYWTSLFKKYGFNRDRDIEKRIIAESHAHPKHLIVSFMPDNILVFKRCFTRSAAE